MAVYEQLIDKGFAEKLTEYEMMLAAGKYVKRGIFAWNNEIARIEQDLAEIVSEVTFD